MFKIIPVTVALVSALVVTTPAASAPTQPNSYWPSSTKTPISQEQSSVMPLADMTGINFGELHVELFGRCGQWYTTARDAGWPIEEWATISKVMWRESRCDPDAWNGADAGLMQINQVHRHYLKETGMSFPTSMFDPASNLLYARTLWERAGWEPWIFKGVVPG